MNDKPQILTVSEITRDIKILLENTFEGVWIEGEISNFKLHTSGHIYFSLKDEKSHLSAVFFKGASRGLKFQLADGLKVLCFGRISVYEKRGTYQLYVEKIEPKGVGALQIAFEELKRRLAAEGFFDSANKKPIPFLPERIGIVTSETGAAVRDMLKVIERRFANVEVIINPVLVQGEGAAAQIAQAIREFNRMGDIDVIIVGRGGGSLEDLWAFNEEETARAIFDSAIPVISAVGHEIDFTIADFTADLRAPTPSAAAELVVPEKEELIRRIRVFSERISQKMESRLDYLKERVNVLSKSYVLQQPLNVIHQYQQRVDDISARLDSFMGYMLDISKKRTEVMAGKLAALSPLGVLERGYSITFLMPQQKVIKDSSELKQGDEIETRLKKGSVKSKIFE